MRLTIIALISSLLASCVSAPTRVVKSVQIEDIKLRYIKVEQFKRINEYLTNKENTGNRIYLRSKSGKRAGFYFILILDENIRKLPRGTQIVGEFYNPDSIEKQSYEFILPPKRPRTKEIFIGLTGEDWPKETDVPVAWRFTIKDANGKLMAQEQSYLWSL